MTPRALLNQVLESGSVTSADLDAFITANQKEGQHLEYKSGGLLEKKTAAADFRSYVSAMANSDGGLLLVGVDDGVQVDGHQVKPRVVDGVNKKGSATPTEWAWNCLQDIAFQLHHPPPRIFEVPCRDKNVLVCAITRNALMVAVAEREGPRYYMRFGDTTLGAPEYLIADLLMGRRERPILDLSITSGTITPLEDGRFDLRFAMHGVNEGTSWIDRAQFGVVGLVALKEDGPSQKIPHQFRASLDVFPYPVAGFYRDRLALACSTKLSPERMPPLHREELMSDALAFDASLLGDSILFWQGGAFCIPKNGPIQWYQLDCAVSQVQWGSPTLSPVSLRPLHGKAAMVGWKRIPYASVVGRLSIKEVNDWESLYQASLARPR